METTKNKIYPNNYTSPALIGRQVYFFASKKQIGEHIMDLTPRKHYLITGISPSGRCYTIQNDGGRELYIILKPAYCGHLPEGIQCKLQRAPAILKEQSA